MQWKCSRCRATDARQHHSELRRTAKTPIYSRACTLHTVTQFIPAQQLDVLLWEQRWEQRRDQRRHWGARGAENAVNPTFRIRKTAEQVKTHKLWYICSCSPSDVADLIQNVGNCSTLAHSTSNHPNWERFPSDHLRIRRYFPFYVTFSIFMKPCKNTDGTVLIFAFMLLIFSEFKDLGWNLVIFNCFPFCGVQDVSAWSVKTDPVTLCDHARISEPELVWSMWYVQNSHKEQACLPVVSYPTNCDYSQANTVLQTLLPHLLCLYISALWVWQAGALSVWKLH